MKILRKNKKINLLIIFIGVLFLITPSTINSITTTNTTNLVAYQEYQEATYFKCEDLLKGARYGALEVGINEDVIAFVMGNEGAEGYCDDAKTQYKAYDIGDNTITLGYGITTFDNELIEELGYSQYLPLTVSGCYPVETFDTVFYNVIKNLQDKVQNRLEEKNITWSQNKIDATVSLGYNCGEDYMYKVINGYIKNGDQGAWDDGFNKCVSSGNSIHDEGLLRRRKREYKLFTTGEVDCSELTPLNKNINVISDNTTDESPKILLITQDSGNIDYSNNAVKKLKMRLIEKGVKADIADDDLKEYINSNTNNKDYESIKEKFKQYSYVLEINFLSKNTLLSNQYGPSINSDTFMCNISMTSLEDSLLESISNTLETNILENGKNCVSQDSEILKNYYFFKKLGVNFTSLNMAYVDNVNEMNNILSKSSVLYSNMARIIYSYLNSIKDYNEPTEAIEETKNDNSNFISNIIDKLIPGEDVYASENTYTWENGFYVNENNIPIVNSNNEVIWYNGNRQYRQDGDILTWITDNYYNDINFDINDYQVDLSGYNGNYTKVWNNNDENWYICSYNISKPGGGRISDIPCTQKSTSQNVNDSTCKKNIENSNEGVYYSENVYFVNNQNGYRGTITWNNKNEETIRQYMNNGSAIYVNEVDGEYCKSRNIYGEYYIKCSNLSSWRGDSTPTQIITIRDTTNGFANINSNIIHTFNKGDKVEKIGEYYDGKTNWYITIYNEELWFILEDMMENATSISSSENLGLRYVKNNDGNNVGVNTWIDLNVDQKGTIALGEAVYVSEKKLVNGTYFCKSSRKNFKGEIYSYWLACDNLTNTPNYSGVNYGLYKIMNSSGGANTWGDINNEASSGFVSNGTEVFKIGEYYNETNGDNWCIVRQLGNIMDYFVLCKDLEYQSEVRYVKEDTPSYGDLSVESNGYIARGSALYIIDKYYDIYSEQWCKTRNTNGEYYVVCSSLTTDSDVTVTDPSKLRQIGRDNVSFYTNIKNSYDGQYNKYDVVYYLGDYVDNNNTRWCLTRTIGYSGATMVLCDNLTEEIKAYVINNNQPFILTGTVEMMNKINILNSSVISTFNSTYKANTFLENLDTENVYYLDDYTGAFLSVNQNGKDHTFICANHISNIVSGPLGQDKCEKKVDSDRYVSMASNLYKMPEVNTYANATQVGTLNKGELVHVNSKSVDNVFCNITYNGNYYYTWCDALSQDIVIDANFNQYRVVSQNGAIQYRDSSLTNSFGYINPWTRLFIINKTNNSCYARDYGYVNCNDLS